MEEKVRRCFLSNGGTKKNLQVECAMAALTVAAGIAIEQGTIENCAVAGAIISSSSAGICVVMRHVVNSIYKRLSAARREPRYAAPNFGDIESFKSAQSSSELHRRIVAINDGNI